MTSTPEEGGAATPPSPAKKADRKLISQLSIDQRDLKVRQSFFDRHGKWGGGGGGESGVKASIFHSPALYMYLHRSSSL